VRPAQGREAAHQHQILDRHRHAVEPPDRLAAQPPPLGLVSCVERAIAIDDAKGVDLGLQPIQAIEDEPDRLDRRHCPLAVEMEQ